MATRKRIAERVWLLCKLTCRCKPSDVRYGAGEPWVGGTRCGSRGLGCHGYREPQGTGCEKYLAQGPNPMECALGEKRALRSAEACCRPMWWWLRPPNRHYGTVEVARLWAHFVKSICPIFVRLPSSCPHGKIKGNEASAWRTIGRPLHVDRDRFCL